MSLFFSLNFVGRGAKILFAFRRSRVRCPIRYWHRWGQNFSVSPLVVCDYKNNYWIDLKLYDISKIPIAIKSKTADSK